MPADQSVTVIGAGVMGTAIGQVFLQHGHEVTFRDVDPSALEAATDRIVDGKYGLDAAVERDILAEAERDAAIDRLSTTTDLETAVDDADFVIEAVPEDLALKGDVFRELDAVTDDVPLATNTGGFPIESIANAVADQSCVVGTHFFNPAQVMSLVEVVRTDRTSQAVVDQAVELMEGVDKTPIVIEDANEYDEFTYGFVANRCHVAMREEAQKIVEEGIATKEQVDIAMREGYNLPAGPFEIEDDLPQ
jgi:3-hydroxybutyryl-CoA dehydrogenase